MTAVVTADRWDDAAVDAAWMWLGMLASANIAMLGFSQRSARPSTSHTAAMLSGGNLGMVLGMLAGGWCASQVITGAITATAFASFVAMTAGMLVGMLLGTWLVERLIGLIRDASMISRGRTRAFPTNTAG